MDPLIRDDMIHSVDQTLVFYGKKLDKAAVGFWLNALRKFDLQDVKRALMIYTERGKYAPKPVDIIEILDNQKAINRAKLPPPAPPRDRKSTDLDRAWIYVIKWIAATGKGPLGKAMSTGFNRIDDKTEERYLALVNNHARQMNTPDALPEEFKIAEVWA